MPRRIRTELTRVGIEAPAVSTVHHVLVRNGLVATGLRRRPKADKRFEREIANDLWQIDATEIVCVDDTKASVVDLIDDHSRYLLAAIAGPAATGELAWDAFELAASRYGLPHQVLSDNGGDVERVDLIEGDSGSSAWVTSTAAVITPSSMVGLAAMSS